MKRPILICLLFFCLALAAGPAGAAGLLDQGRKSLNGLQGRLARVLALCRVGHSLSQLLPAEAARIYGEALSQARELYAPAHQALARKLADTAERLVGGPRREKAARLATSLEKITGRAWPLRVVAEGALQVAPEVALRALDLAEEKAKAQTSADSRDRDLASIAALAGRLDPPRALRLAKGIFTPLTKAVTLRTLAEIWASPQTAKLALLAARGVTRPRERALALSRVAKLLWNHDRRASRAVFSEAAEAARDWGDPNGRAFLLGEVVAQLAHCDPQAGLLAAQNMPDAGGASFRALRVAAAGLVSLDGTSAARALEAAFRVTGQMLSDFERDKGISLVALDMVKVDAKRAQEMLKGLGPGAVYLKAQVAAELMMREVARGNWPSAGRLAGLPDDAVRLQTLLRLAAISIKQDRRQGLLYYRLAAKLANRLRSPLARRQLALAWADLDSDEAVQRALSIGYAPTRVAALAKVAERLIRQGKKAGAEWALIVAGAQVEKMGGEPAGHKVDLLCLVGLVWSRLEPDKAQEFFDRAVATARALGS